MTPEPARDLYLAGTGTFAMEVAEWAQDAGWTVSAMLELRDLSCVGSTVSGRPVLAPEHLPAGAHAVIAAGGARWQHYERLREIDLSAPTLVHPRAHVSSTARLAAGCIVGPGAVVGAETAIGEHTLVARGALIGHHVRIGRFVSLLPGANVGGNAELGDRVTVGMGAVVVNALAVGAEATIAAGAVVVRPVVDGARVQGVPAREFRR
jgi:acetyltransferase EpsM